MILIVLILQLITLTRSFERPIKILGCRGSDSVFKDRYDDMFCEADILFRTFRRPVLDSDRIFTRTCHYEDGVNSSCDGLRQPSTTAY